MTVFGKSVAQYVRFLKPILGFILVVGIVRLLLSLAGVSVASAKFFSLTGAWLVGLVLMLRHRAYQELWQLQRTAGAGWDSEPGSSSLYRRSGRAGDCYRPRQHLQPSRVQRRVRWQDVGSCGRPSFFGHPYSDSGGLAGRLRDPLRYQEGSTCRRKEGSLSQRKSPGGGGLSYSLHSLMNVGGALRAARVAVSVISSRRTERATLHRAAASFWDLSSPQSCRLSNSLPSHPITKDLRCTHIVSTDFKVNHLSCHDVHSFDSESNYFENGSQC